MENCIFCKIIKEEAPCLKIYEDNETLAFLDISGDAAGHTLVVPKVHVPDIMTCPDSILESVIRTVRKVPRHYTEECGFDGVNVLNASGAAAQQSVLHLHFHIIPRRNGDGIDAWPQLSSSENDLEKMQKLLRFKD